MIVLAHADGALPNLALMRLGAWFKRCGEFVKLVRKPAEIPLWVRVTRTYGSSIFQFTESVRAAFDQALGPITWGGTGVRVESSLAEIDPEVEATAPDYSFYPNFEASLGFLTRGCRLRCGFCVVPKKEGKPRAVSSVRELWRGEPYPRHLHLLDNDAFAPQLRDHWREAVREIREGDFRVCFSQGVNLRLIDEEAAAAIASIRYVGHDFKRKRLFTAWDNLRDEGIFRRGIDTLARAGVPAKHLRVYMLVGYDARETWESLFYRFNELVALGCEPFPMVYDRSRPELLAFQRWAVRYLYRRIPFPEYGAHGKEDTRITPTMRAAITAAWAAVARGWRPARLPLAEECAG